MDRTKSTIVACLLLVATALPHALASQPTPLEDVFGRWIVAFHDLSRVDLSDGTWNGNTVVRVNDALGSILVSVPNLASFQAAALSDDNVRYTEWDDPLAFVLLDAPNDPLLGQQYALDRIAALPAWEVTPGARSVIVSVIDTGILHDHEDLAGTIVGEFDFAANDAVAEDDCGHGTHTAGTIGAVANNGKGIAGVSQSGLLIAKALAPLLVLGCAGSNGDIADAITWSVDQGADIISMSLGGNSGSSTLRSAIEYAWDNNVLLVGAAGNNGPCTNCIDYPARYEQVIAVTCTTDTNAQCDFSSDGPESELAAPGLNVISTYDDGGYKTLSGTSMSTPHVAGVAALALSLRPELTNVELREQLHATAVDLGVPGYDAEFGHGQVHAADLLEALGAIVADLAPEAVIGVVCEQLSCGFDATASSDPEGSALVYAWDLGDGTSADAATTTHTYAAGGAYVVRLTVTDAAGQQDVATRTLEVTETVEDLVPTARIESSCEQLVCSFDGSTSTDPEGEPLGYAWDLGDGASSNGASVEHAYETDGTYEITLTVTDAAGNEDTATTTVDLVAETVEENLAPIASFEIGCAYLTCSFDASTSSDPEGGALTFAWTLGDGAEALAALVEHAYATDGTYDVTLTVTDPEGASSSLTRGVRVTAPPPTAGLHEAFDGELDGWTVADLDGPAAWTQVQLPSGGAMALGPYGADERDHLVTPVVDLAGLSAPQLRVVHAIEGERSCSLFGCKVYDSGSIEVSSDDGATWTPLVSGLHTSDGWVESVHDLSAWSGSPVQLRFGFTSDGSVHRDGWLLDLVAVENAAS